MTGQGAHLSLDLDHFRARVLQDALTEATAQCWVHRAHQFQQAAPRPGGYGADEFDYDDPKPGEYYGKATVEELREAWRRCMATAQACLRHADLLRESYPEEISPEVWAALEEVA